MSKVVEIVAAAITPIVSELGYEIVEIEYTKVATDMNLTVYIYQADGISLDDCEKVHVAINPIIDELNPTGDEAYVLNVSSPGLDRKFKFLRDFERNYGKEVEVKLYAPLNGKKVYEGILVQKLENSILLENCTAQASKKSAKVEGSAGDTLEIEMSKIACVRLAIKF